MGIVESTYAELKQQELKNNPYSCLHMADIDINPHQIEAFTFALSSLELGGAILADEVGLGKTIEAGLVIKYLLCSGKDKILLIMPSNLRKQWQVELEEKFDIDSLIVDSSNWEDYLTKVKSKQAVIIVSYHFASKRKAEFGKIAWDFCVFDEAHRLRNVYKNGSKMANALYELTKTIPKILLTATPMQNTLLDIYGLVQFIDDRVFYSKQVFSERYLRGEDYNDLKVCLEPVVQRTLRKEVAEYIQFSERKEMTIDFELSPMEIELYVMINNYLKKEILYALPNSHRTLITSVIRKLLASSSMAVAETFKVLKGRLETLKETTRTESADESIDFFLSFFDDDEIETDDDSKQDELYTREKVNEFIQHEIDEVTAIINKAESIKRNAKMTALKQAVETAFVFQDEAGIKQRIVVFTESIRTQQYMFEELSHAGYEGQILKFNGSTNDPVTKQIYKAWKARNYGKYVGSRNVELKNAIVEAFRDEYKILLVTDSGSEGLNLQFCNTIINYDLPWNPQKIEQRIGRCHRYGQKNDVVVINLLSNSADSEYGYICAVARKLGHYDAGHHEIKHVNWTPKVYEPVYLCKVNRDIDLQEIAITSIGRLPGSDMSIPIKNINALVTHNTAVLGILGVGKSCLTFELIKKIVAAGIKVICLDITNQYASDNGLYKYIPEAQIVSDLLQEKIDELESQSMRTGTSDSKSSWGNVENFKKLMESAVSGFMDANNKSVMVLNPEKYIVRQAATDFRITELKDVSLVEKVQIISEIVLKKCMDLGQIDKARCCVVYEEAHSLTPEFNSVVVKDDNSHANGTAKVILQGRKYGLGCIIVTQRTANVTKSILNQCNTIFALRVFDDTGKSFLENYIGKDYSDTLPTLEERHAIAIGKGIGLKQPVILQLNDMKYLQTNDGEKIVEKNECVDVETEEITPNL